MGNYKFYTPLAVAELLVELLPDDTYKNVIDICCGSWNLLYSAKKKYPNANITGVDIDKEAQIKCISEAKFYQQDGRLFALEEFRKGNVYDLILSNPPFGYLREEEKIFTENKYGIIINNLNNNRYENELMKANFLLADDKSILIFILPSTFVEGEINKKARHTIAKECIVHKLIKLPLETFGKNMINTYAVILQKNSRNKNYTTDYMEILYSENKYSIGKKKLILHEKMLTGDWSILERKNSNKIEVKSFRGKISSNELTEKGEKVLHCSNQFKDNKWVPGVRYCDKDLQLKKSLKSMPGDILVNRVGKCAGYWTINDEEVFISDCLIAFRSKEKKLLLKRFQKETIKGRLNVPLKGVATRYISKTDIIKIL